MFELQGQVGLVTGASRGIGREIAEVLAGAGVTVILASRNRDDVTAVADSICRQGGKACAVALNVADPVSVQSALETAFKLEERIDILVNNAGIARDNLLLRMKEEEWREVLSTNLDGVFYVTRGVVSRMLRQRYGRVINITSVVAQMGNSGQANYVASKAGLIGFTKTLARELASRNITVNAVAPGYIETDMTSGMTAKMQEKMREMIPLGRLGTVRDIAGGVLFLASKEAGYITGHVLNINGGMYM